MATLTINGEQFTDEEQEVLNQAMNPARSNGAQLFQGYAQSSLCNLRALSISHQAFGKAYRQQATYVAKDWVRGDPQQGLGMFRAGQIADRFERATGQKVQAVPQGGQVIDPTQQQPQQQQQGTSIMGILEKFSQRLDGIEAKLNA